MVLAFTWDRKQEREAGRDQKRSCGISVAEFGIYGCYYGYVLRPGTSYPEIYEYAGRYL